MSGTSLLTGTKTTIKDERAFKQQSISACNVLSTSAISWGTTAILQHTHDPTANQVESAFANRRLCIIAHIADQALTSVSLDRISRIPKHLSKKRN